MFMQNFAAGWDMVIQQRRFSLPYSKLAKACYVDYRDVAEVAAIALTGNELSSRTFELCAPGMVNRVELVAIISAAIGRLIEAGESPFALVGASCTPPGRTAREPAGDVRRLRSVWFSGRQRARAANHSRTRTAIATAVLSRTCKPQSGVMAAQLKFESQN